MRRSLECRMYGREQKLKACVYFYLFTSDAFGGKCIFRSPYRAQKRYLDCISLAEFPVNSSSANNVSARF